MIKNIIYYFIIIAIMIFLCGCKSSSEISNTSSVDPVIYEEYGDNSTKKQVKSKSKTKNGKEVFTTNPEKSSTAINNNGTKKENSSKNNRIAENNMNREWYDEWYGPKSVTIVLYDVNSNKYGITWNTELEPSNPVIQVCEGSSFNENSVREIAAQSTVFSTYSTNKTVKEFYVTKGIVEFIPGKTYSYRVYDKGFGIASEIGTFTPQNHNTENFTFLHFSDSQVSGQTETNPENTGLYFSKTLSAALTENRKISFAIHTGDFVEWSKYEAYWENMLDTNYKFFMSIPFMPISGNHETTYRNGSNESFKHFNLNLPLQDTKKGFYYFYDYGNTRFIMINTNRLNNDNTLMFDQYDWLVSALDSRPESIKWTVVSMHCPMYSVGKYGSDSKYNGVSVSLKNQLSKLFAQKHVDLVLQGHDHAYSKTFPIIDSDIVDKSYNVETVNGIKYFVNPKGTVYSMNGPAGNQTRSPCSTVKSELYDYYATSKPCSFAKISITQNLLTVEVMCENNGVATPVYSYGIKKS